jgi:serine/threonine protein phosphatase PrpC
MMNIFERVQNEVKNEIIRKTFERLDKELDGVDFSIEKSGTTANVVLICGKTLTCANVGDSRAVLATLNKSTKRWKSIPLSKDHKPTLPIERTRIENSGG